MNMELGRSGFIVFDDDDVNATIHLDYILGWIEISVEDEGICGYWEKKGL